MQPTNLKDWSALATRRLKGFLATAGKSPALRKLAGQPLQADVLLVGTAKMIRLNGKYRGKPKPTDVLSFPAHEVFQKQGHLGELVICLPVLKAQARELGHSPKAELDVLLVHGILHLLGFDHEQGKRQAAEMSRWERKLLAQGAGLIERSA